MKQFLCELFDVFHSISYNQIEVFPQKRISREKLLRFLWSCLQAILYQKNVI